MYSNDTYLYGAWYIDLLLHSIVVSVIVFFIFFSGWVMWIADWLAYLFWILSNISSICLNYYHKCPGKCPWWGKLLQSKFFSLWCLASFQRTGISEILGIFWAIFRNFLGNFREIFVNFLGNFWEILENSLKKYIKNPGNFRKIFGNS